MAYNPNYGNPPPPGYGGNQVPPPQQGQQGGYGGIPLFFLYLSFSF